MIKDPQILSANYTIYRNDRTSRGGGVLIAVSSHIPSQEILTCTTTPVEMVTVKILVQPIFYICCVYIPPNCDSSYQQHTITALRNLPSDYDIIITGDFNTPDICWHSLFAFSKDICDTFFSLNLQQLINTPTHVCGNILDILATNSPDRLSNIRVDDKNKFCCSDHYFISFDTATRHTPARPVGQKRIMLYSRADFTCIDNSITIYLHMSPRPATIDTLWSTIKDAISSACQLYVPTVLISRKNLPKWFDGEARHLLKQIRTLKRSAKGKNTVAKQQKINCMEEELTSKLIRGRRCYETSLIQNFSSTPKKLYRHLRTISVSKHSSNHLNVNSIPVTDPVELANIYNEYFHSTFTTNNYQLPIFSSLPEPAHQLSSITIEPEETYKCLTELDPCKAPGSDNISAYVLKNCASSLTEVLTELFNLSIRTGYFPPKWKIHKIRPIPKKGTRTEVSNYRPISLLSITSKVMEKINNVIDFVRDKLNVHQFGFLKHRSCLSQLLIFYSTIINSMDSKIPTDVVYLDLSKAFDSVSHNKLLYKLWMLGITGPLWQWFRSYLEDRHHFVEVENNQYYLECLRGVLSFS